MISFELKNWATTHHLMARRNGRTRDEFVHTKLPERGELLLKGRSPLCCVRRRHSLRVSRGIIRHLVSEMIGHGSKKVSQAGKLVGREEAAKMSGISTEGGGHGRVGSAGRALSCSASTDTS
jgi:hypothetical protein